MVEFPPGKGLVGIGGERRKVSDFRGKLQEPTRGLQNFPESLAVNIKDKGNREPRVTEEVAVTILPSSSDHHSDF